MSHAILSPSSAHRWLECPPSARLEQKFQDTSSEAALEGTLAHELAEVRLQIHNKIITPNQYASRYTAIKNNSLYSAEMEEFVDDYASFVLEQLSEAGKNATLYIEEKVDLQDFIQEGFGTIDAIIIADGLMRVIDLKYGKGVKVDAKENSQMRIYAAGALVAFSHIYEIERVQMHIYQPRIGNYSMWEVSAHELLEWAMHELRERALIAFAGKGELKVGEHCKFCTAKPVCKAQKEQAEQVLQYDFSDPFLLSDGDITQVLRVADSIGDWLSAVQSYALGQALQGKTYDGYKLVEGRSVRQYRDQDEVVERLIAGGWKEELIYEKKLLGITAMEKLIGKKTFSALLSDAIVKPAGKPTLVPESDKREPLQATQIAQDFA